MPCYHPLQGYRGRDGQLCFSRSDSIGMAMQVPCGQCIGCRLERSRQWAMRCMHEASLYEDNAFITLTYDDAHLPEDGSLDVAAWQRFMKRLRKRTDRKVRFFHCGEYGERLKRPHYHALLFNYDFEDKKLWTERQGLPVWRSATLESLWPHGMSEVGSVTFESAAYVARYVTKKVTGRNADAHYESVNARTGEVVRLAPEYATMSRGGRGGLGGIGQGWFEKFADDVYPRDEVIVRGKRTRPPRYYDEKLCEADREKVRRARSRGRNDAKAVRERRADRLSVREVCAKARVTQLKRGMECGC